MYAETKAIVAKHFTACPDTGQVMLRRVSNRNRAGAVVGHRMVNGYTAIMLPKSRRKVYAHHVVYFLSTGVWPPETGLVMDHVDRNRGNNALANLRLATPADNAANHGARCVRPYRVRGGVRYRAEWKHNGEARRRAGFTTEEEALEWLRESRRQFFGQVLGPQVNVPLQHR